MIGGSIDPRGVGSADVAAVRRTARRVAMVDVARGGSSTWKVGSHILDVSQELLRARCPAGLRPELHSAVGDLAHATGFAAFDAGQWSIAQECWRTAASCATEAGDVHLHAQALGSQARQETWLGRPAYGLALVDEALADTPELTAGEVAMLWGIGARAHAVLDDLQGTLTAIGRSEDALADRDPGLEPPHMAAYSPAVHAGNVGHALADLVCAGHADLADRAAFYQATALSHRATRHQVFCMVNAATVVMAAGDPVEAVSIANTALDVAGAVNSHRLTTMLWRLHQTAGRHTDQADVDELRHRISAQA